MVRHQAWQVPWGPGHRCASRVVCAYCFCMYPMVHNNNLEKRSSETLGLAQAFSEADSDTQELEGTFPHNAAVSVAE